MVLRKENIQLETAFRFMQQKPVRTCFFPSHFGISLFTTRFFLFIRRFMQARRPFISNKIFSPVGQSDATRKFYWKKYLHSCDKKFHQAKVEDIFCSLEQTFGVILLIHQMSCHIIQCWSKGYCGVLLECLIVNQLKSKSR